MLALCGPLLRRRRPWPRLVLTLVVIGWFTFLTRAEPSVLRAASMAGLAAVASTLGRPAATRTVLALAVTVVVLVDPLLVWSVGFWLSVGATAGIGLLARPLAARTPGPRPLGDALGTTLAAQAGVAPILVVVFGELPLAALPANLLAVPAAAPVTIYGLPAGIVASMLPDPLAHIVQLPTVVCVRWLAAVADGAAALPSPGTAVSCLALAAAVLGLLGRAPRVPPHGHTAAPGTRR